MNHRLALGWMLALGLLLAGGCLSDQPGSASLASVIIESATPAQVHAATVRVFADEGYQVAEETDRGLVFEREGTQKDRVLYGRYEEPLTMRIVVQIEPHHLGGVVLRADAYADHGGGLDDPQKVMRVARRPYQALLDSVRASLIASDGEAP